MSVVPFRPDREWIELMSPAVELAKQVANTEFVPRSMRGNPAAITAAILYGDEVGLGPMQSLAKIAVIDGRPSLAAEAQRALILSAGHEIWIEEATTTRVTVAGRRRDSDQTTRVTWTMDDARRAKLDGKQNWRTYPRQMLLARSSAELARAVFADVIGGLPATEEILEEPGELAEPVALETAGKATRQRKRAPAQVSAGAPGAPTGPPEPEPPPLPGDEPEAPQEPTGEPEPGPAMISEKDRRFLHARKNELGLADDELKDLIEELTGQRSTTQVPSDRFGDLLAAMQQAQLAKAEPEGAEQQLDVGQPPHEDRA